MSVGTGAGLNASGTPVHRDRVLNPRNTTSSRQSFAGSSFLLARSQADIEMTLLGLDGHGRIG